MTRSAGMIAKTLRSPNNYREWRVNRGLYITAWIVLVLPMVWTIGQAIHVQLMIGGQWLHLQIQSYVGPAPEVLHFNMIVAGLLGVLTFWHDRTRGYLSIALEGPVSRRAIWQSKIVYAFLTLASANLATLLMIGITSLFAGMGGCMGAIILRTLYLLSLQTGLAMTALAIGALMESVILAGLGTASVSVVPLVLGSICHNLPFNEGDIARWSEVVGGFFFFLGPFNYAYPTVLWQEGIFSLLAFAWALLSCRYGLRWWEKARLERYSELFVFPWVWKVFYGFLGIISALVVTTIIAVPVHFQSSLFLICLIPLSVLGWFAWRTVWAGLSQRGFPWAPERHDVESRVP